MQPSLRTWRPNREFSNAHGGGPAVLLVSKILGFPAPPLGGCGKSVVRDVLLGQDPFI